MRKPIFNNDLVSRLPEVRGRYSPNADLSRITWFRVGGLAEVSFRPADMDDLAVFISGCPKDVPVTVIGVGSNLLIRDGGVPGVVVRLGREFARCSAADNHQLHVGAGVLDVNAARTALEEGIAGLEFLSGIPGTMGGALRMNAGAYGREIKDVLVSARVMDAQGLVKTMTPEDMGFGYRHCALEEDVIFLDAILQGSQGDMVTIANQMDEISKERSLSQPVRSRTGGSTFANPEGFKAWELIDHAGCRGLIRGGAQVSEQHCNFLINTGDATAADLEGLGEEVRRRVLAETGITLHWEIRRIGQSLPGVNLVAGTEVDQ